jgi:hypothetical protein
MGALIRKPARTAYPDMSSDRDDYAVMHDGKIVGRIVLAAFRQAWNARGTGS